MSRRILGIDLGTTNTCVAVMEGDRPVVIPNPEGGRTTPSVVAFTEKGEILVGESARRQAVTNPERTVHAIKRLMGIRPSGQFVDELRKTLPYPIGVDDENKLVVGVGVRSRTPVEISAIILKAIKTNAEEYFGEDCSAAVITCPAYFDDAQRAATQDAGRVAGLNVLRVINEPTAAALAYGRQRQREGTIVVFDWGGGTFDCTVLDCSAGVVQVKATRGDSLLGGTDVDLAVIELMREAFDRAHGFEVGDDAVALQRMREAAEAAKIELSSANEAEILLPFLASDSSGPQHLEMSLSRARFEKAIDGLVSRCLECVRQALGDAGLSTSAVDEVLLVGGSTKIPLVAQRIEALFGKPPRKGIHADEAVAIGAAIQAGLLGGEVDDLLLLDVLPLSLGIAEGDQFAPILQRNTPIPTYRMERFSTVRDFQNSVRIRVYQGDHPAARDNRLVGTFRLENLPPLRKGEVTIEVTFEVDANGLLQVSARHAGTGRKASIDVRDTMRLTDAQIERLAAHLE